ncbi:type II secretion system F family protein [Tepidamorphus sp. 3E244]|uniref:type II secretion system F family protein n=1 Tax=Tepidamorphus sp. 3E244 TaxID=3385498 RepID=UPI0038FC69FC
MQLTTLFLDPTFLASLLAALAVGATVMTLAGPLVQPDKLKTRMKTVALERDKIRQRERARLNEQSKNPVALRSAPKASVQQFVDKFNLRKHLEDGELKERLRMAGLRGDAPLYTFIFLRIILPPVFFAVVMFYFFVLGGYSDRPPMLRLGLGAGIALLGFFAPNIFLKNRIQKRQLEIQRVFPDALDLMLICVEAGMSIEQSMRRVSEEVGERSVAVAEEFGLCTAELSYLQDRRVAYENLAKRTGLPGVKAVTTALIQAERYGTPLAHALRVMAQENRDMRMSEAEKKAAGLPPKLTVPMILFFLPVLFIVILGPAAIRVMEI